MAGIGFVLRKLLQRDSLTATLSAYVYAGVISAGPLVLSILGILLIGFISSTALRGSAYIVQFQVSVTYLIAASLIVSGAFQLLFSRFISDRLFARENDRILSAYNAVSLVTTAITGLLGLVLALTIFESQSFAYRALMLAAFVTISQVWLGVIFLASVKQYRSILAAFLVGYTVIVATALMMDRFGVEGLLAGFLLGHIALLMYLSTVIHLRFRSPSYISWDVFDRRYAYPSLVLVGLLFNLGVWLDKIMFWFSETGQDVIGPLRASVIYDIPVFISYLCIIPGMAVFLLRLESDFVEHSNGYYGATRSGGTLGQLRLLRDQMVASARMALYEILKIQIVVVLLIFAFGESLLRAIGISPLYMPLLQVDVIAASLQVLFLGVLNIFFYLDRRRIVLKLTTLFAVLNGLFTWLTLEIGPNSYGYGFAGSLLAVTLISVYTLNYCFDKLEFDTYMLQESS
ncbi:histidine kinase [Candidimonas sp. SYP-B2681]|uniref:exopolysaccharide Pel transporter PelG n=1 Tax=Candidimonas sp. SYP-B2681 TaxID=2497686 RepID=UPI000F87B90D|nr:exopolysaccharide Pel transporter PelG [Candidimonas sp. SYP-B2681]RTZ47698.1 histidine kinase [Candidimonas sp. SYP-B2681]